MKPRRARAARPGYDGRMELAADEVENPYDKGKFETVVRNVRESSLTAMRARGQLSESQYKAGEWIRIKIEGTRMSSGAIDPSYEPVDVSGHSDPIPIRVIAAAQDVGKARRYLGEVVWPTVDLVCGQGHTITEAANRRYGLATEAQTKFIGRLLREALDELAVYLGYATKSS